MYMWPLTFNPAEAGAFDRCSALSAETEHLIEQYGRPDELRLEFAYDPPFESAPEQRRVYGMVAIPGVPPRFSAVREEGGEYKIEASLPFSGGVLAEGMNIVKYRAKLPPDGYVGMPVEIEDVARSVVYDPEIKNSKTPKHEALVAINGLATAMGELRRGNPVLGGRHTWVASGGAAPRSTEELGPTHNLIKETHSLLQAHGNPSRLGLDFIPDIDIDMGHRKGWMTTLPDLPPQFEAQQVDDDTYEVTARLPFPHTHKSVGVHTAQYRIAPAPIGFVGSTARIDQLERRMVEPVPPRGPAESNASIIAALSLTLYGMQRGHKLTGGSYCWVASGQE